MNDLPAGFPLRSSFKKKLKWLKEHLSVALGSMTTSATVKDIEEVYDRYLCVTRSTDCWFSVLQSYRIHYAFNEILKHHQFALSSPTHIDIYRVKKLREKLKPRQRKQLIKFFKLGEKKLRDIELQYGDYDKENFSSCSDKNMADLHLQRQIKVEKWISHDVFKQRQLFEQALKKTHRRAIIQMIFVFFISVVVEIYVIMFFVTK